MPVQWGQESCDRYDDPVSGARVIQLTSAAMISNNIYGEQPYASPDGKRIMIARCNDFVFDEYGSLLVHELDSLRITMVARKMVGVRGIFNSAWSGLIYYWTEDRRLMRFNMMTLETEEVYQEEDPTAPLIGGTVSPDQRYIVGMKTRLEGPGAPIFQVIRFDLQKKICEVIFEHPEICNPHLQFNPIDGEHILVQNNRGTRLEPDGSLFNYKPVDGTLFVIDKDGKNLQYLPAGSPATAGITGHECFVGDTGRVLYSVSWNGSNEHCFAFDSRYPTGNIFTAKPGDTEPTVFEMPEHLCNHVCVSRCGRYFVADSHGDAIFKDGRLKAVSLVIGNLETGRYRVLVQDSWCSGGGNQCSHTHQYLTADNRYVIYNADMYTGIPQVFAARIPEGFLASLD